MIERIGSRGAAPAPHLGVSRRTFTAAGGSVAVAGLLAACVADGGGTAPSGGGGTQVESTEPGAAGGDDALATVALADVPVGGGLIVSEVPLVVTQPTEGEVHAFSGICTHQGCAVGQVDANGIVCPCHSSTFDLTDGSVLQGPAAEALPVLTAELEGDSITVTA
ncbi:MAG: ubiquinol-cytochrome c reductase iron-sulfur subunit [Pseudoclavibacter sp.]